MAMRYATKGRSTHDRASRRKLPGGVLVAFIGNYARSRLTTRYTTGNFHHSHSWRQGDAHFLFVGLVLSVECCAHPRFVAKRRLMARISIDCREIHSRVAEATSSVARGAPCCGDAGSGFSVYFDR